jgi:hypothetical protein
MIRDWWTERPGEYNWLEVTNRRDLGVNLNAPQSNENGSEFWSYSLLKFVQSGDIVFHYHGPSRAIVARSIAKNALWEDTIVWAARGSSARNAGIQPHTRTGWYVGLEGFSRLEQPVALEQIRDKQIILTELRNQLAMEVDGSLYFPFELGERRPLRPMQGYLFKLPRFFVELFPSLSPATAPSQQRTQRRQDVGTEYRPADEEATVGQRDPFSVDPALVERALRGHASTQNRLAAYLRELGFEPRSPLPDEPNFDLAWIKGDVTWVAEIKSLTRLNEEKQLRLGLGQLLRYRQLLSSRGKVCAVLVTEYCPNDPTWKALCEELGILLVWPESWHKRIPT